MNYAGDGASPKRGASGLSGEQALRCALLKNWHGLSYRKLAFHLQDSLSFQAFCRIPFNWRPSKACLQENISRIRPRTWARIRRALVRWAGREGLETGRKVRGDSTAVASPVHHPTDSGLLCGSVRVVTRLLRKLSQSAPVLYSDHSRRAKRRHLGIGKKRGKNRLKLYKDLLTVARWTAGYAGKALEETPLNERTAALLGQLEHYAGLMRRVIDQTERRVLQGDSVPAGEKVVSIFEEHTDIIKKGQREPTYGHKIFLSVGKSSLILDCYVKRGNPADETQFQPMLENIEQIYGRMPRQVSFDAGRVVGICRSGP
jgi:IS5 family transposase